MERGKGRFGVKVDAVDQSRIVSHMMWAENCS